jgi:hypothetical protein
MMSIVININIHRSGAVLRFHFCDVRWVLIMPSHKRFSMSDYDPTDHLPLMATSFEKTIDTVEN